MGSIASVEGSGLVSLLNSRHTCEGRGAMPRQFDIVQGYHMELLD